MWEKLKALSQHPAAKACKKYFGDPVQLYAVFLIMTTMYYYHKEWAWLYTLIALPISYILMRFYDFVASKRFIGPVCYLLYMIAGLYVTFMITNLGEKSYPITFFVWFLTPQGVVEFSMLYTIAIYMLMIGFITSAVYYFAQVRYRMVMQFVIMLIPLSLYAKEGLHMPALLVILLLSSYFLLMVYCRQLKENKETRLLDGFHSGMSIALYVAAFSVIAAIIPKPQFQADREFIDNAMAYSTWSDVLMNAISMFTESTDNTGVVSNNARTLYYARSNEALRLRTQTFTYYLDNDSWNTIEEYDKPLLKYEEPLTYQPRALTQAILDAAAADPAFARKYNLSDLAGTTLPEQKLSELYIYYVWYNAAALPSPTRTQNVVNGTVYSIRRSASNALFTDLRGSGAVFRYYSDTYANNTAEAEILSRLKHDSYAALLDEAGRILQTAHPEEAAILAQAGAEFQAAEQMQYTAMQHDYASPVVSRLAAEITQGLESDLEKAKAIERYFQDAGYVYDLSYAKEAGQNIDDFLNTSHTGVCYEYATAMTLMCRSIGLPARLAQGFSMNQPYEARFRSAGQDINTNFVIKMRDAHAFPEVYVAGYGWISFEPTVPAEEEEKTTAENLNVTRWGYVFLALTLLAIGIWAMLPYLREKQFRRKLPAMEPSAAAAAAFLRMRGALRLTDSVTVCELQQQSEPFFRDDKAFAELDALLYDPARSAAMTSAQLAGIYILWQTQRKAFEKAEKQRRKAQKKSEKA